jgi:hypothetical protein
VVEELFTYWSLEDADDALEELEDALIVSVEPPAVLICFVAVRVSLRLKPNKPVSQRRTAWSNITMFIVG